MQINNGNFRKYRKNKLSSYGHKIPKEKKEK
jgi:hypothetical protein